MKVVYNMLCGRNYKYRDLLGTLANALFKVFEGFFQGNLAQLT